jgi:hypothetical protein
MKTQKEIEERLKKIEYLIMAKDELLINISSGKIADLHRERNILNWVLGKDSEIKLGKRKK